jgi:ATP-dependent DNA helicase RecG
MTETQNIEYKTAWRDEYLKWISGFANANGGKIYIGIDDNGIVVGIADIHKLMEDIPNKIVNYLGIVADVNLLKTDDKKYLEIIVSPSSVPVSYKGIYHYRTGSTKQELKGNALHQFLLKRLGRTWDDLPCENATIQDIDPDAIRYFFNKASISKRLAENIGNDDLKTTLENLDLVTNDHKLKNAALLLFGQRPSRFFPSVSFKIGRFINGDDDLLFQDVVEGNILQMADKVIDILKSKYLISPIHYDGLQRIEKLEIPEDALREAIFNAIIHKDYTGAPVQLSVYNDKIILWNEGRLPDDFTIETLLEKHPSRPANKNIADIFFKA